MNVIEIMQVEIILKSRTLNLLWASCMLYQFIDVCVCVCIYTQVQYMEFNYIYEIL